MIHSVAKSRQHIAAGENPRDTFCESGRNNFLPSFLLSTVTNPYSRAISFLTGIDQGNTCPENDKNHPSNSFSF